LAQPWAMLILPNLTLRSRWCRPIYFVRLAPLIDVVFLLAGLGTILLGSELFTNGIEWFGQKLNVAEGAVGSIFAAIGTALPETLIPFVAILFSPGTSGTQIGTGAILGAPFMLSTLAMFVSGLVVVMLRGRRAGALRLNVDRHIVSRDLRFFLAAYAIAIGTVFLPWRPARLLVALGLAAIYGFYVYLHVREEANQNSALAPLHFHRRAQNPHLHLVHTQVLAGLGCILLGAESFVRGVDGLAESFAVPPLILALVLAPIATELPEAFNSVLWIRQGKDTLALGNVTGAMVFQACIPTILGITLTEWKLTSATLAAFVSAGIAAAASIVLIVAMRLSRRLSAPVLLLSGLWYIAYLAFLFAMHR